MRRTQLSIAGILTVGLATAATLVLGTIGYVGYTSFCNRQRDEFRQEHTILADQLAISLTLPLWNFDREQIEKVIESAMRDNDVERVLVRASGDWSPLFARGRDANWKSSSTTEVSNASASPNEKRNITMAGENIGQMQIYTTPQFLAARLRQTGNIIISAIGLLDTILVAGLYFLIWRIVLRPLQELERHAVAVSSDDETRADLPRRRYLGELESLRGSIEKMIGMLESRYHELSKSETRFRLLAETLRESEEKFSRAFRAGPDAMAIAELETGRYLEINEGFERLFGYDRDAVIGHTSLELGIWRDVTARNRFVQLLRTKGAVRDLELESVNRRGEGITFQLSAECMEFGGEMCIVSVIHDVTDRKRAEKEHAQAVARERQAREEFTRRLIAAQEAERRRLAGELHDSIGQNLLLVKNRAQLALTEGTTPPELRWQFESIHDMAAQAIVEVRQISHDLRPYQLDQLGLTRALEAMIDSVARTTGFPINHKIEGVDDVFPPEGATHLYRIVQESVSNILKHSRAQHARVMLERDIHHVRLSIEDDGRGFTPDASVAAPGDSGFGLKNLAERVRILSGTLRLDTAPGRGTRLEVLVPLPEVS